MAVDLESRGKDGYTHLSNTTVQSYSFSDVGVVVRDRRTKQPKTILSEINGIVKAGELLAIMGPSGSGKTTLLNVLAHRIMTQDVTVQSKTYVNGVAATDENLRNFSAYVEQEDALIGALTIEETLYFAAQLSLPSSVSKAERQERIKGLIRSFGLQNQAEMLIGTPIRKGISGGQKRRVSVASQLITAPKILFLDEPTSGLDSTASFEVISFVRELAKEHKLLVIASIHQPSTTTFNLFDKLILLSNGKLTYNGNVSDVQPYFDGLGFKIPLYMNPAEHVIQLINTDFARDNGEAEKRLSDLQTAWNDSEMASTLAKQIQDCCAPLDSKGPKTEEHEIVTHGPNPFLVPITLLHRSYIKSIRDIIAYGVRIAMYLGLAILMGTTWLRLATVQENIQSEINAIFFGGAFMSFMAVAYIPSFLEDRTVYVKERAHGLVGPTAFMVANFITGLPFLFLITVLFSLPAYFLSNFQPTATAFMRWILFLFLDLLAAESLVVLISAICPIFVVALAATAFANGLWMCTNGFMIPRQQLNVFWRYVFHYIDYQAYVFKGMMVNEFSGRNYECGEGCHCMFPSALEKECKIEGKAVLKVYGLSEGKIGEWVGILIAIVFVYRLLGWVVLYLKRT